jgi:hypothetical protein
MFIQPSARRVHSKPSYMEAGLQITLARRNNIIFLNYYQKSHNLLISNENIIIIFFYVFNGKAVQVLVCMVLTVCRNTDVSKQRATETSVSTGKPTWCRNTENTFSVLIIKPFIISPTEQVTQTQRYRLLNSAPPFNPDAFSL